MQVKKFEKLNLSKFDAFKQNELTFLSAMAVEGGTLTGTGANGMKDTDNLEGGFTMNPSYKKDDGLK